MPDLTKQFTLRTDFRDHRHIPALRQSALALLATLLFASGCKEKKPVVQAAPPQAPPPETLRKDLVMANDHLCWANTTNLFSGIAVEFYKEGGRWSRVAYSNGVVNGASEVWYPNGQLQVEEHFKNGVSDGLRRKFYEDGKQQAETTIVQGSIEGRFRRWHDNGQLAEQIEMKHGKIHGVGITYFPSGSLQSWSRYEEGKELEKKTWKDGEQKDVPK